MVCKTMHCSTRKVSKALRQKSVDWIMKNSNVRQSLISRDALLITDAKFGVKWRVPKLLLECSIRQLYNELIASLDYVVLLGCRHADTNYMVISDTMICSLTPSQLRTIKNHQK